MSNYSNTQLTDHTDCMMKHSTFIRSVNKLMASLVTCRQFVLINQCTFLLLVLRLINLEFYLAKFALHA